MDKNLGDENLQKAKLLKNAATFTASTESIKVVAQNIRNIRIALGFLGTGTTATTLANMVNAPMSQVKLTVGGEIETLIRGDDLFALNYILQDLMEDIVPEIPAYCPSTTTDNTYGWLKLILPIGLSTDKDVYIELTYAALTNADTTTVTLQVNYGDKPFPSKPVSLRFVSGNVSTSFVEYDISVAGKKLVGLLIFSTTSVAEGATTLDATVEEIKLLVKREEKMHAKWWALDTPESWSDVLTGEELHAILAKYRYIDFSDDPMPADDLKAAVKSLAATDAFRLIGVYR